MFLLHGRELSLQSPGQASILASLMSIHAAMSGLGVALENRAIAAPQLASGALVIPFDVPVPLGQIAAYYLLGPPEKAMLPKVESFRAWVTQAAHLTQEAEALPSQTL